MGRFTSKTCRLITMLIMTSLFFLVEIIVGYITNSIALVADSFHMLSDVVALIVALASIRVSTSVVIISQEVCGLKFARVLLRSGVKGSVPLFFKVDMGIV